VRENIRTSGISKSFYGALYERVFGGLERKWIAEVQPRAAEEVLDDVWKRGKCHSWCGWPQVEVGFLPGVMRSEEKNWNSFGTEEARQIMEETMEGPWNPGMNIGLPLIPLVLALLRARPVEAYRPRSSAGG
jgi:hypothetical protein